MKFRVMLLFHVIFLKWQGKENDEKKFKDLLIYFRLIKSCIC